MSREDIMKSLKLTSGGKLTEAFNDLISCDFIRKYNAFGNKNNSSSQICTPYFIYITLTEPLF